MYFGSDTGSPEKLQWFEKIVKGANINGFLSHNIEQATWEKFVFISPLATLTTYLDLTIGQITENPEHRKLLLTLLKEVMAVADAKGIGLPDNIFDKTIHKFYGMPYENTSSMHSDFKKGGDTEYKSLTEYVVRWGDKLGVETPTYDEILNGLIDR